jgi:hypothetical protein
VLLVQGCAVAAITTGRNGYYPAVPRTLELDQAVIVEHRHRLTLEQAALDRRQAELELEQQELNEAQARIDAANRIAP